MDANSDMNDAEQNDDVLSLDPQRHLPRGRCPACRGDGQIEAVDEQGNQAVLTCPVCRGRGRIAGGMFSRGQRAANRRQLFFARRRSSAGGRPSPRGPLLPLEINPGRYGTAFTPQPSEQSRGTFRPIQQERAANIDGHELADFLNSSPAPGRSDPEATDLVVAVARAAHLGADELQGLRLADVLWGNSALYIRRDGAEPQQVHIPEALRNQLHRFVMNRTVMGIPQDAEAPLFRESPQAIAECLAKATAQEHWRGLRASISELSIDLPPIAANDHNSIHGADGVPGAPPGAELQPAAESAPPQTPLPKVAQAGVGVTAIATATGPLAATTVPICPAADALPAPLAVKQDLDILGTAGSAGIDPLHGIGPDA